MTCQWQIQWWLDSKPVCMLVPVGGAVAQRSFVCKLVAALAPMVKFGSCGKVWMIQIIQISSNIWIYNYEYLKFFYKQCWAKKVRRKEKIKKKFLQRTLKYTLKFLLKFLQSSFEVSLKNLMHSQQTMLSSARDAVISLPHKKCFVRTWHCSSIAAVCSAALSWPSLVSAVTLVLVNPNHQSGVAGSQNHYLSGTKKIRSSSDKLQRNFEGTLKELWRNFERNFKVLWRNFFIIFFCSLDFLCLTLLK